MTPSPYFAFYRLPHASQYVKVEGETQELFSCAQLNDVSGFVIAPFEVKPDQPIVVIRPDRVTCHPCPAYVQEVPAPRTIKPVTSAYHIDFSNFHAQLLQGTFRKIVLARCADETESEAVSHEHLFLRACQLYPRMFIALVHTPQSGTWLTATPEILLEGHGHDWRTIALAGTMKLEEEQLSGEGESVTWSTKNIEEQRIVATYIAECLERFTTDFREEGPRTVRAANLVHLRSDFTFTLPSNESIGHLIQALHPTPAVCGLPKREAFQFITNNEHTPRRYYSGFMGPFNIPPFEDPTTNSKLQATTHLYVSLRCMNIDGTDCHLYAGGGLLKDSTEEQEWQETEAKLGTMRRVLDITTD